MYHISIIKLTGLLANPYSFLRHQQSILTPITLQTSITGKANRALIDENHGINAGWPGKLTIATHKPKVAWSGTLLLRTLSGVGSRKVTIYTKP